ncbi:MAG: hypothetical protein LQ348_004418 [Seirophora lacunosa]|nr:MAG: hypothetical protein LQ348_004418 [Seirophora lacunosa]
MAQNDTQRQQQMDAWLAGPVSKPPPGVSSDFVNALRTTIHINLWANAVFYVACIFAVLFICNPRAALWKPDVGLVHCHDQRTVRIASAAVNGISDVAILVIPISVVWRLQMQRKKKLRAIAVLASGLFGCAAGVVRIALITKEFTVQSWNNDQTWNAYPVILWSYAEISLGIICGCMTAVPAFYRHVRDHAAKQQATPFNGKPHERDIIERHLRPTVDVEMTETESTSSLQSR